MSHTVVTSWLNASFSMVFFGCAIISIINLISPAKLSRETSIVLTPFISVNLSIVLKKLSMTFKGSGILSFSVRGIL